MQAQGRLMSGRSWWAKWGRGLALLGLILLGSAAFTGAAAQENSLEAFRGQQLYDRGLALLKAGKSREAVPLLHQATLLFPGNRRVMADYVLALVWAGDYPQAVAYYRSRTHDLGDIGYLHKNLAKAFYEVQDFTRARELYARAWQADPRDEEAFKGLIFSLSRLEKFTEAVRVWEQARLERLIKPAILGVMKVYLLEKLGASEAALKTARVSGMKDEGLLERLEGDKAVNRLRWEEKDQALVLLEAQVARQPKNIRARQDYLVALRKKDRMQEVLQQFALLQKETREIPYWVNEAVADAYLYLRKPRQAAEYYRLVLIQHPDEPFEPLKGLFYSQVEMREWRSAAATLDRMQEYIKKRQRRLEGKYFSMAAAQQFEFQNNEAMRLRGLFLLYQDKNKKAAEYFTDTLARAGLFTGFRDGLAQARAYQQKPRRALEQYQVSQGVDDKDKDSQIGMAYALNTLNHKAAARKIAGDLYRRFPTNYHVINLYETLWVEDRPYLSFDYYFTREYQGAMEHYLVSEFNCPVNLRFRIFSQLIWQTGKEDQSDGGGGSGQTTWNRLAGGFDWIVAPTLTLRQSVSFDYVRGDDPGSFTKIVWQPSDPLKFTAEFDSFSLTLPIRARAADLQAMQALASVGYTASDLRDMGLTFILNMFSDTNRNYDFAAFFNQTVINHPDVKVRAGFQAGYSRYTDQDVDYFSPPFVYTMMFTPTIHWTHYQYYDRHYRTSFYPRVGFNKQIGYDFFPVAGLTLEQKLKWSKRFTMTANVSYDLRVYDGVYSHVLGAYVGFKKYF
jgi:Flp pilus assembly protein TadD